MSWPTDQLEGVALFEGEGKAWLHAICLAVNERQEAIDITKTEWILADDTESADPVLSDFDGIRVHGDNSPVRINMQRAQGAIKAMLNGPSHPFPGLGYFTEEAGVSALWTIASIEADMGLGAFSSGAVQFHDLNYWKQLKESLDRMIHARRALSPSRTSAIHHRRDGNDASADTAYSEAYSDSPTTLAASYPAIGLQITQAGFSATARIWDSATGFTATNSFTGSLQALEYEVASSTTNYPGSIAITVGSASGSIGTGGGTLVPSSLEMPLGGTGTIGIDFVSVPSGNPFPGPGELGRILIDFPVVVYYFDIASELTDQA